MAHYHLSPNQLSLLKAIQAFEFAAVDLNLFLDTHPGDVQAMADYNMVTNHLAMLKADYLRQYGPLAVFGMSAGWSPWNWIEEPWPWEIEY